MTTANTAQPEGPSASRQAASLEEDFVGADRALERLALQRVRDVDLIPPSDVEHPPEPVLALDDALRDALSEMLAHEVEDAPVADPGGTVVGVLSIEIISHTVAS